ncbi:hypothetical protein [uncultured Cetobacterium sp.]|uniref:hypothetical protein n=1 Tax=uncultured Cetobacterium sp. TaxID=527638 RepID=UPI002610DEFC|nr:hypothetical protein [uncultured Cetobacterium sp.]
MVIEFTKDFLEELYLNDKNEFTCLTNLIKNNINENIYSSVSNQNFIYLDYNTCEFLDEKLENSKEIVYYKDNWTFILNPVMNLKRLIIVKIGQKRNSLDIEYNYNFISKLISKKTKIVVENINDIHMYKLIINYFNPENKLSTNFDFHGGNGSQTLQIIEEQINSEEIMVVIADKDQKYFGQINPGSTPVILGNKIQTYKYPSECIILEYKNIEALIPYQVVKENLNPRVKTSFDKLYTNQKNKKWLKYFDFKKGLSNNLYDGTNILNESLEWWKVQFNSIDILNTYITSHRDDIIRKGIVRISKEKITLESLENKSSFEQKEEYKRIGNLVYSWIIANEYYL